MFIFFRQSQFSKNSRLDSNKNRNTALKDLKKEQWQNTQSNLISKRTSLWSLTYSVSHESGSTPCISPDNYLTINYLGSYDAIHQLMIIQRQDTVTGSTQSRNCTPSNQSSASSSTTEETFANWSGWAQGIAEGPQHEIYHGLHPME